MTRNAPQQQFHSQNSEERRLSSSNLSDLFQYYLAKADKYSFGDLKQQLFYLPLADGDLCSSRKEGL
jgi:hypothetical protein